MIESCALSRLVIFLFCLLFDYYAMKIKYVQYTSKLGILANFLIIIENTIIKKYW